MTRTADFEQWLFFHVEIQVIHLNIMGFLSKCRQKVLLEEGQPIFAFHTSLDQACGDYTIIFDGRNQSVASSFTSALCISALALWGSSVSHMCIGGCFVDPNQMREPTYQTLEEPPLPPFSVAHDIGALSTVITQRFFCASTPIASSAWKAEKE